MQKIKINILFVLSLFLFCLAGCSGSAEGKIFRFDIAGPVLNLDPQFATNADARMIIGNLFEGLVVQDADGHILPGAAENYTVSPNGLVYTFTLREGVCWSNGTPLTAQDFVFAFHRLLAGEARSPFANDYTCIAGAQEILSGGGELSELGVTAKNSRELVFTLAYPCPYFLELLTGTAAMPCNEAFFLEARGRYGLERKLLLTNGPFTLSRWDNAKIIQIFKNEAYVSEQPTLAGGVNFYIGRANIPQLFADGKSDVAILPYDKVASLSARQATIQPFEKTVWCIVFNQNHPLWGNALLRQGLSQSLDRSLVSTELPPNLTPTEVFIPPAMRLLGRSYRTFAGQASPLAFDVQRGAHLFELGLKNQGIQRLPSTAVMLVPDTANAALYMGLAQQSWQKHLSCYISLEKKTARQIDEAFREGSYQMLLMPFSPSGPQIQSLLGVFATASPQNYFGYHNARYDELCAAMQREPSAETALEKYRQAEVMLLSDAVIIPVYFETGYYAAAPNVQGVELSPFAGRLLFKYATKP